LRQTVGERSTPYVGLILHDARSNLETEEIDVSRFERVAMDAVNEDFLDAISSDVVYRFEPGGNGELVPLVKATPS
jgi:hypothetical protein